MGSYEKPEFLNPANDNRAPDPELAAVLARLQEAIEKRGVDFRNLETPSGFAGTVTYDQAGNPSHLTLETAGTFSSFTIDSDGIHFEQLRGPDYEHITEPHYVDKHTSEAKRLFSSGELNKTKSDEHGQYELPM